LERLLRFGTRNVHIKKSGSTLNCTTIG